MSWQRWLIGSIVLAVLLATSWLLCVTYLGYSAERDYAWALFVLSLAEDYVIEHRAWPKSWHDLEQVRQTESWEWPRNSPAIQKRIAVDFDVNLNELADQSVDQFRAIRPNHPNVLFDDEELRRGPVGSLLKAVRQLTKENNAGSGRSE